MNHHETVALAFILGLLIMWLATKSQERTLLKNTDKTILRLARERNHWKAMAQSSNLATVTRIDRHIGDAQRVVRGEFKP